MAMAGRPESIKPPNAGQGLDPSKTPASRAEILDAVSHAVIATDPQGKVVYWNRAAEALYGWMAEETHGRPVGELIVPATA